MLKSIVVIEDQEDNREMLSGLLRVEGFEVCCAADGLAGVELIERVQPDAAIVDIGLPEIDGYEVARRVRTKSSLNRNMLLVALTGYGQAQDVQRAMDAGFNYHLVKPLQPDRLLDFLRCATTSFSP